MHGTLSTLQVTILETLANLEPHWTLVGGAALAGVHLKHRRTRDLDLFWRQREKLGELVGQVRRTLENAGFTADVIQEAPAFARLRVGLNDEVVVVDLVADPPPALFDDEFADMGTARIQVASRREILVDKLCALLGRAEVRDLVDVQALLDSGEDLEQAVRDAPSKDGGFSAPVLAWVLNDLDIRAIAAVAGVGTESIDALCSFRDDLIRDLLAMSKPE